MLPLFFIPWISFATPVAVAPGACIEAPRAQLVADGGFDTVRVVTADGAPGAGTVVSIASADRFLSLTARPGGATSLATSMGGEGTVTIALDPDLDAAAPSCVQRIELVRGGVVVGKLDAARAAL